MGAKVYEMGTARLVKHMAQADFRGDARLYMLSAPVEYPGDYDESADDYPTYTTNHVVVSAATVAEFWGGQQETYIFPADAIGTVLNWGELPGSFKGGLDHAEALRGAGFIIEGGS